LVLKSVSSVHVIYFWNVIIGFFVCLFCGFTFYLLKGLYYIPFIWTIFLLRKENNIIYNTMNCWTIKYANLMDILFHFFLKKKYLLIFLLRFSLFALTISCHYTYSLSHQQKKLIINALCRCFMSFLLNIFHLNQITYVTFMCFSSINELFFYWISFKPFYNYKFFFSSHILSQGAIVRY